ncbi:MAG TPA: hypothetical protein VMS17_26170 [Gemmataceae bacterium]|nr:hypothetical protein [Gemmataceae bacterium]
MPWPLSQDYNEAIQTPKSNFADPDLKRGEAVCNALGIPMPYSGNFADVYQVRCPDGKSWAVKCFTRQAVGLRERYQEISTHLKQANLPFMVDFTYLEKGIRVAGQWYPVLKMQWVEGLTLNQFVRQYLDKPAMLEALLQIWGRMARHLRSAEVGHCDLQHGNVLLVPGGSANSLALKLIDYDGMWVPALAGTKSGEVGHACYQHPQRLREGTYNLEVDRFPLLLIAAALRALKTGGQGLWDRYDNGDNLLFKERDLQGPLQSHLFLDLTKIGDPLVGRMTDLLVKSLRGSLEDVPLLEEALPAARAPVRAAAPTAVRQTVAPVLIGVAPVAAPPEEEPTFAFDESAPAPASSSRLMTVKAKRHSKNGVPKWLWVAGAVAAVGLIGGAAVAVALAMDKSADKAAPSPGPPARSGEVVVELQVDQPGAEVDAEGVNGQTQIVHAPADKNSVQLLLKPGNYVLIVRKAGYAPFRIDVPLPNADQVPLHLKATLTAIDKREPIVFADFEGKDYGDWKATGGLAFGSGPVHGTLPNQQPVTGFEGQGLVNSFVGGDNATGKLTSPEFKIERSYISFLIGGGNRPGRACINLLVTGNVVRSATGQDSERLEWCDWDVRELAGKTAHFEIVDNATGPWGHISIDQIEFRDSPRGRP